MKNLLIISLLIASTLLSCQAQDKKVFSFDNFTLDKTSAWSSHITGNGAPCKWEIINDAGNNVLAQVSNETESYRFNIIVNDSLQYKNLKINLRFKGVKGNGDQGGGPVWRYQDENNYYVARANPLENNFRVYKVVNGRRKELKNADVKINSNQWYSIKITMIDDKIKCYFNNKLELELTDNTFKNSGKIGLWTKSDAVTYFDNLEIIPIK